ncbi:hypothetical protein BKA59DRAFT_484356 [Fusarium tricinctum]|uniref:gamma-glutamylcyclotransferase n=1 Tax=Fusarium tricinctum TaxID=61284 RepID=A0A8K0RVI8_9HYPO|nr:hypothetical protein BKA59DRAFT_484356 [Fusarium tricinctum]
MHSLNASATDSDNMAVAPPPRALRAPRTLYFAYGSNLCLAQMAKRCPNSIFKGKATLDSYRWQINERGVANVIQAGTGHSVEGLLYSISPKDQRTLDRNEGVSKGFYQKYLLTVTLEPHQQYTNLKTARLAHLLAENRTSILDDEVQSSDIFAEKATPSDSYNGSEPSGSQEVRALVYVSDDYTTDGKIREEYIARMQNAANDAVAMGVSRSFVDKYMVPFLDPRQIRHLSKRQPEAQRHDIEATSQPQPPDTNTTKENSAESKDASTNDPDTKESTQIDAQHGDEASYVDLSKLKSMNRDSEYHSSVTFPQDMLEAVAKANDSVTEADAGNIYIILVSQKDPQANSSFSIAAAAQGVRLANELSMKTFREVCARNTKHVVERGDDPDEIIVREGSPGDLSWRLEKDTYLHLRVSRSGEEPWLRVWVEPQLLLEPL